MGMFGSPLNKKPMFGQVLGMDMMQNAVQPNAMRQPVPQMQPMMEPEKPKFFGEGGVGRAIAGTIGDFLMQNAGMTPTYAAQQQHERALQQRMQEADLTRQQEREDFIWKQQNERPTPTAMERNLEVYSKWTPEQRRLYGEMNPIIQTLGDGSSRAVNRYETVAQTQAPAFAGWPDDEGGQTPTVSGNFPRKPIRRNNSGY